MRFEDLTTYRYGPERWRDPPALNIGWLGDTLDVPTAEPFLPFLDKLGAFCRKPVNRMRRFHVCGLCGFDPKKEDTNFDGFLGNGEIRVGGDDGILFAAPVMINHFVRDAHYDPPTAFKQAVMMHCEICLRRLERKLDGRIQGLFCAACDHWDVVATKLLQL